MQQGRDVGFHRHAPHTNSKQLRRVTTVTLALFIALGNDVVASGKDRRLLHHPFPTTLLPSLLNDASSYTFYNVALGFVT